MLAGCQRVETADQIAARIEHESQIARMEIEALNGEFERWLAEGQIDSLAMMIAEDAWLSPANMPVINGRADWSLRVGADLQRGKWTEDLITESIVSSGPIAVERGRYVLDFAPGPESPTGAVALHEEGTYLWHWKRVDQRWQLAAASWHSNRPAR